VCLYVKTPFTDWQKRDTVAPTQNGFTFRSGQDGEYWFNVVTIDKAGNAVPPDVAKEAPAVIVVVDTQPPQINLAPWTAPTGEVCLRCALQDANPDYQGLKIAFQGADQSWFALDPYPGQPGTFRLPGLNAMPASVRVTAKDLAAIPPPRIVRSRT